MKAVVAAFNQEKALVGAFSVLTNLRMELFQALVPSLTRASHRPGVDTVQTNLHMGLPGSSPHWSNATLKVNTRADFAEEFHTYELDWTKHHLAFSVGRKYFFGASCKNICRR